MTVIIPTFKGSIGLCFLSRGTIGMLKLFEVTVCALRRLGLAWRWTSDGGRGEGCDGNGGMVGEPLEFWMALLSLPLPFPVLVPPFRKYVDGPLPLVECGEGSEGIGDNGDSDRD
jgi:hypothetical protein